MPLPKNNLVAIVAATLVLLTGCSSQKSADRPGASHNPADVMFAQMMIPHHEQAIEMSALAGTRAESTEVKVLAAAIEKAQDPEIRTMRGWLTSWDEGMGHMGHDMPGIMNAKTMKELEKSRGSAFDRLFLSSMIAHHEGAIDMAKDERRDGRYRAAVWMAGDIIRTQTAEIAQMRNLLAD